jgi:hypothetical protein
VLLSLLEVVTVCSLVHMLRCEACCAAKGSTTRTPSVFSGSSLGVMACGESSYDHFARFFQYYAEEDKTDDDWAVYGRRGTFGYSSTSVLARSN